MHLHLKQAKVFISKENNLRHNHFIQRKYTCSFVHEVVKHLNAMETLQQVPGKKLDDTFFKNIMSTHTITEHTLLIHTYIYTPAAEHMDLHRGTSAKRARERERAQSRSVATTYQSRFSCNPKRDTENRKKREQK